MQRKMLVRGGLVAGACALVGAAGGIAGSAAAPSQSTQTTTNGKQERGPHLRMRMGFLGGGPAVHGELVVPNKNGTGFQTVTLDNGTVKSVNGDQLTITEGTQSATYKDVTLTIPSGAKVRRNFADAQLSDLKAGDRVHVSSSPDGTFVFAVDASPQGPPPGVRPPHGHGVPGGPPPYGGPPGP
jgi:hypothetical protein